MSVVGSKTKPRIILGLATFGPDPSSGARITDLDEFNRILDYFQSRGYNEVDTSRFYINGQQEAFTREAKWKQRGLALATKHYPSEPGQHFPEKIRAALEKSLEELGTDCVDIFYLHAADRSVPFEDTLREVDRLHREGKFVRLGLSNFAAFEVAEVVMACKANGWVRPTIYQGIFHHPRTATNTGLRAM
jgi:aflatoxin B1 aldehyde reductase